MAADLRSETFPFGIAGRGLSDVTRQIPADEPPALAPNAQLQVIGRPVPRQDGRDKVTGATRYTVDLKLPGMLHGRILRSTWPHARIRSVDVSAAQELPGVRAAIVLARPDDTSSSTVRYVGAPVAAIAAISMAVAEEALRLIRVDAQPLPFVVDLEQALLATAPAVFDSASAPQGYASGFPAAHGLPLVGNLRGPAIESRGDIAQGFAQADVTVDAEYRTEVQTHCCLEPHATVADWRADGLTVYQSTQFTAGVRQELANAFGLPLAKVRVVVDGMGGGFGSKSQLGNYGRIAVMLSRQAGTPVRVALDRHEEQTDAGNRPGTWQQLRIGARRDGTLTAISLRSRGTAGVAVGAGVGNNAQAMYECPNFDGAQYDVFTNAGPGCAMRGPGNTPGAWGLEQAIDELAEKLGMDPLVLRDRIDASPVRREERRLGAERIGWARRRAWGMQPTDTGPVRRGIGMAQSIWSANVQTNSSCEVRLHRDGTVEVLSSVQDIGTGIGTVLAQVVAEVFGLRAQEIHVRIGDTEFPAGPPSYGSRTTA
ncbi:MAG TPA: xanthine dehydrogenase family protein molybdopterin-binding subunit, partial [Caldimonas sp.]